MSVALLVKYASTITVRSMVAVVLLMFGVSASADSVRAARLAPGDGLPFVRNIGQVASGDVAYFSRDRHSDLFVSNQAAITYKFRPNVDGAGWVIREQLAGADWRHHRSTHLSSAAIYFQRASVKDGSASAFHRLHWENVYPGIDFTLHHQLHGVEKIFTVKPGGVADRIRWEIEGAHSLDVDGNGELVVETGLGPVRFTKPVAFQLLEGRQVSVPVHYIVSANTYGFEVGEYDHSLPLTIDPLLASTYLGSTTHDADSAIPQVLHDPVSGDIIVGGVTLGTDFPVTTGAYDSTHGANSKRDVFITRLSSDLSTLRAATFLGGSGLDSLRAMALNAAGQIVLAGDTDSQDFPTTAGVHRPARGAYRDAFVAVLSGDLSSLVASTLYGESGDECSSSGGDYVGAMGLDADGNIVIAGNTNSRSLPVTEGAYQSAISTGRNNYPCGQDAYLAKFDPSLTTVLASTYYGTGGANNLTESVSGIAVLPDGNVAITGWAPHATLPVSVDNGDSNGGTADAYIAVLDSDFNHLIASRYLGGSGNDVARTMTYDTNGNLYIAGSTSSLDYPTTDGGWLAGLPPDTPVTSYGFVAALDSSLQLLAATYLNRAIPYAAHFDQSVPGGEVVLAGASAVDFPYPALAYDPLTDNLAPQKVMVARLDPLLSSLQAGTSLHGQCSLYCGVTTAVNGQVTVVGTATEPGGRNSVDLTVTAYDASWNGGSRDLFISSLSADLQGVARLAVAPVAKDFGSLSVPVSSFQFPAQQFLIRNSGDGWLSINEVSLTGEDTSLFAIIEDTCRDDDANLRPEAILPDENKQCTVTVEFRPFSIQSGNWSATLQIVSTDVNNPVLIIPLTGRTEGIIDESLVVESVGTTPGQGAEENPGLTRHGSGGGSMTPVEILMLIVLSCAAFVRRCAPE